MTYYISGPMSGIDELNKPAFEAATRRLNLKLHNAISPLDLPTVGEPYGTILARDVAYICTHADALYMLSGWEYSPGARAEHAVAMALNLLIVYEGGV